MRDHPNKRRYTIFVVDRQDDLRQIRRVLINGGFRVHGFGSGDSAFKKALASPPSMFILESVLPHGDGLRVCERIRRTSGLSLIPVLFLARRGQEADKVAGLGAGADDYVTKPFGDRELIARVTASLRRCYELSPPAVFQFGKVTLDSDAITLAVKGRPVKIPPSEFRLLEYFVRNPGRTFSRDHLLQVVHATSKNVKPRLVDQYVLRIRAKIEVDKYNPEYLRTVRGFGYCFDLPEKPSR
jgi:DNA-binding response OmpR family regulator